MDSRSLVAWLTLLLLAVNAVLVWMYLRETKKIRIANEGQLEAQIIPAIVVRSRPGFGLTLVNVGKGPALDVICSPADRESKGSQRWSDVENFNDFVVDRSFVEVGGERNTNIRTNPVQAPGGVPILNGKSLQCQYRSLSGRTYWTVVDFDKASGTTVIDTRFSRDWSDQE